MLRSDLVQSLLKANPDLPQAAVRTIVDFFFETIVAQLVADGRVELRGFGAFSTRQRDARMAHNPGSGEAVFVAATRQTYFRPSTSLPLKSFGD